MYKHLVRRLAALITVLIMGTSTTMPAIASACEGGGGGPNFAIEAKPTSVTTPEPESKIVITDIEPFGEPKLESFIVKEEKTKEEWVYNDSSCKKTYKEYLAKCEFPVTYRGTNLAEIVFVALDEHEAGSGTASIKGTPPIHAEPSPLEFKGVKVNEKVIKTVKVKANLAVTIKPAKTSGTAFSVTTDGCNKKLEVSKECTIEVGFLPTEVKAFSGKLEIPYELTTKATGTLLVSLSGEGI